MSKAYNFCNNCGKTGHAFHQCKHPITSIGIIAVRQENNQIEFNIDVSSTSVEQFVVKDGVIHYKKHKNFNLSKIPKF